MNNNYSVSILSFNLKNENNQVINYIDFKDNDKVVVKISCTVFFPEELRKDIINSLDEKVYPRIERIYSVTTYKGLYIADQYISLKSDDLKQSSFMKLEFQFNCPKQIKGLDDEIIPVKNCHIQLAYSTKGIGELGIGESIRVGTFLETTIPVSEV